MALGGGTFTTQNKVLPGSYINFVSASNASVDLSDRGLIAVPLQLDFGIEGSIFTLDEADFQTNSMKIFGYSYDDAKLKDVREMFRNARKIFMYRLNGGGVKATITIGNLVVTAKYGGIRGNDIKMVIAVNVSDASKYDVTTYIGTNVVDVQTVTAIVNLVSNDYVTFSGTGTFTATAGTNLAAGTNKTVTGTDYSTFLSLAESYAFNTLICPVTDSTTQDLFVAYVKRRRDTNGVKFQVVAYQKYADYEGVISVENTVTDAGANAAALVYWVGGIESGCDVNKSNTNKIYDGEYTVNAVYTQTQLETNIKTGKFMFHKVGDSIRVLTDINSLVTLTAVKSSDFQDNQTIRVLDQIGNDIAVLFNTKYLGQIPNDKSGRVSLWNDIVNHHRQLEAIRAIEDFNPDDVIVSAGTSKKSVVVQDAVDPVNAMAILYMTVSVE